MQATWQSRQSLMEEWYRELVTRPDDAVAAMLYELRPHAAFLRGLQGRILDVGGGAGLASMFLPPEADLFIIDPSRIWMDEPWPGIRRRLAPEREEPGFTLGVGEELPFRDASFDAVLCLWTFNHAADPARCMDEIHRVLKPGGKVLLVLEDMEPSWPDILRLALQEVNEARGRPPRAPLYWHQENLETAKTGAIHKLLGRKWPLQDDHLPISRRDLESWIDGKFRIVRRDWIGGFLSYELSRT